MNVYNQKYKLKFYQMLIYNKITELRYDQFLTLFLIEIALILTTLFIFKKKLSFKLILSSSIVAILLSLLSMIIVQGFYGGMAYHERFGWPFQYEGISRGIEGDSTPWGINLDIWKFLANTTYWGLFPFLLLSQYFSKKKERKYQIFLLCSLSFYILLTLLFSYLNTSRLELLPEGTKTVSSTEKNTGLSDIEKRKREAIEDVYPEFKNFDTNTSFAGTSIETTQRDSDHYFAYIVNGSGVPIALATCFRVDRMFRVYKIGEYPDYLDSFSGYVGIDPVNCTGINAD